MTEGSKTPDQSYTETRADRIMDKVLNFYKRNKVAWAFTPGVVVGEGIAMVSRPPQNLIEAAIAVGVGGVVIAGAHIADKRENARTDRSRLRMQQQSQGESNGNSQP